MARYRAGSSDQAGYEADRQELLRRIETLEAELRRLSAQIAQERAKKAG